METTEIPNSAEPGKDGPATQPDMTDEKPATATDKQYLGWASLSYGAVSLLIVIAVVSRLLVEEGDPETIFTTTIFIGTLLGGIGTVYSLARAITKDGWSKDVFILTMQTLGVWVVCIGTAASATFR